MAEILWVDTRGYEYLPMQAEKGGHGARLAEVRLGRVPDDEKPFKLSVMLLENGSEVEVWRQEYTRQFLSSAARGFADMKERAERWLLGASLAEVRPLFVRYPPRDRGNEKGPVPKD